MKNKFYIFKIINPIVVLLLLFSLTMQANAGKKKCEKSLKKDGKEVTEKNTNGKESPPMLLVGPLPYKGNGQFLVKQEGGNPNEIYEITYGNNGIEKVKKIDGKTGESINIRTYDSQGRRLTEYFKGPEGAKEFKEYENGQLIYWENIRQGIAHELFAQRYGKLSTWRIHSLSLVTQRDIGKSTATIDVVDVRVHAVLQFYGFFRKTAELITPHGDVIARVRLKNGVMHGPFKMFDPEYPDRVMNKGQYKMGVPTGTWEYGLSRRELVRETSTFDENGNMVYLFRYGRFSHTYRYNHQGLLTYQIYTDFSKDKERSVATEIDPYTQAVITRKLLDENGETTHITSYRWQIIESSNQPENPLPKAIDDK